MRALLCALIVSLAVPALAQPGSATMTMGMPAHVGAEGTAEIHVRPDRAAIRFGVQHQAPTAKQAQEQVNAAMQKVIKAVRGKGVPQERITTERLELSPVYDYRQPPEGGDAMPKLIGYRAANVVRVELPVTSEKEAGVGPVIDAATGAGANTVEGIQFYLQDEAPARRQALAKAAEEARRRADTLAQALGVKLGDLMVATDANVSVVPPPMPMMMERAVMAKAAGAPVQPGEMTVTASVQVRYQIAR